MHGTDPDAILDENPEPLQFDLQMFSGDDTAEGDDIDDDSR